MPLTSAAADTLPCNQSCVNPFFQCQPVKKDCISLTYSFLVNQSRICCVFQLIVVISQIVIIILDIITQIIKYCTHFYIITFSGQIKLRTDTLYSCIHLLFLRSSRVIGHRIGNLNEITSIVGTCC